jgi:putative membrane protein
VNVRDAPSAAAEEAAPARVLRLHPLTFVVGAARELLALLAAGATGLAVGGLSTAFYFTLGGLALGLLFHIARWITFTYTVYGDRIELRRSLVRRSVKTIPRERIRGVDISATVAHRVLRLAIVHIDAGADGGEGELNAVSRCCGGTAPRPRRRAGCSPGSGRAGTCSPRSAAPTCSPRSRWPAACSARSTTSGTIWA